MQWVLIAIIAVVFIVWYEVPKMIKKGERRELWLFAFLTLLGMVLVTAESFRWKIPNPLDWLTAFYRPVSTLIQALLG